jgi:hypothetical protein
MRLAQQSLLTVMTRMVRQGAIMESDLDALARGYCRDRLTLGEAMQTYRALLSGTWGDVIDEDVLSETECAVLVVIVEELGLPEGWVPQRQRFAIAL